MVSAKLQGAAQLAKALESLSFGLSFVHQRNELVPMLTAAAEPYRQRMAELAPYAPGAPDLKENIVISQASKIGSPESYGLRTREETESAVAVGPAKGFFWGLLQEFGTVHHGAQPFMRPAFDEQSPAALAVFQERIWAWLRARTSRSTTGGNL